ncbi:SixA phosphatase family protein [Acetobacter syzygii]|uniref:SixA phosphatase family protein n=1 Tax=Acetobacter syzygii TaxID=146476 RepID=UPI00156DD79C|nr:histidine phosphatase family protein [Acetobacter syzygii]NSL91952.1 histidine phosphatase family protein [Acetobacter syzygii]
MTESPTPRRLILLRHAEAVSPDMGCFSQEADMARRLTPDGEKAAVRCGLWLQSHALTPDIVLCSPAQRTRQTLAGVQSGLSPATIPTVQLCPEIYEAEPSALAAAVRQVPQQARTVLLVGHNPGISDFARWLDSHNHQLDMGFAPASVAVFTMIGSDLVPDQTSWANCDNMSLNLHTFTRP